MEKHIKKVLPTCGYSKIKKITTIFAFYKPFIEMQRKPETFTFTHEKVMSIWLKPEPKLTSLIGSQWRLVDLVLSEKLDENNEDYIFLGESQEFIKNDCLYYKEEKAKFCYAKKKPFNP